ncbi:MAG: ABC transporter permease [Rhodobacteraceae bacterium]|nr:ABC transporter permease [Paracoccaceae bacterium]
MNDLIGGFREAGFLLVSLDRDLLTITLRSLYVSLTAVVIASCIGIPIGAWLALTRLAGRRYVIAGVNGLMGLPPVVVGLLVYILFSRAGPLGVLGLLYTPTVMIIAQMIIATPLIISISHQGIREIWDDYRDLLLSLNATKWQRMGTLIRDGRYALLIASLAGFGRAIGEVGAIMIVGGNIDQATRVLTTAIALETSKGNFAFALGLGFILIILAVAVNMVIHGLVRTERTALW